MARKRSSGGAQKKVKRAFFAGLFTGRKQKAEAPKTKKKTTKKNIKLNNKKELLDMSERYRQRNLGALFYNGKIYDTNHKGKPSELTKDDIRELRADYDPRGRLSDLEVADQYVRHMRRKYGSFDGSGNFLGMLGESSKKPKRIKLIDDFDRTASGRIKGSYNANGRFEPD